MIFLSYIINSNTPTYGDSSNFNIFKKSDISNGDVANNSFISTNVHIGTHIDMPFHFYENGQTIENYEADFWKFTKPLFIEINAKSFIIENELINELEKIKNDNYDILLVKTGECYKRDNNEYMLSNIGFSPLIADLIRERFHSIRVFGFDTISVSSFTNRDIGRLAHKKFLDPNSPILLLEDLDLRCVYSKTIFTEIIVSPLRINNCDGLPCSVFAKVLK